MREVAIRVRAEAVEDVLDRLLPLVPGGVREIPLGREVELVMRGDELPPRRELERAAGRSRRSRREREVPDDWRARRMADFSPVLVGDRLIVRPEWAPPGPERGSALGSQPDDTGERLEIVLGEATAFGAGSHPTTLACLEQLLQMAPGGSFADLGCGSGILAVLAAKLGWSPVQAIDASVRSVEATTANAERNRVSVAVRLGDIVQEAPLTDAIAANVPASVHRRLAGALARAPRVALVSGFGPADEATVLRGYTARGMSARVVREASGWMVAVLDRDD